MSELSYRMIQIGGIPAGLLGLQELFSDLFKAGITPADLDILEKLIKGVRKHNFIPKSAVKDYQDALLDLYQQFYQSQFKGSAVVAIDYGYWNGHPRENIPWFPVVSADLCDGCGNCLEVCPKDVFLIDENQKAIVNEPFLCIVGCCFCKSACDPHAILMPDRAMLNQFQHGQRRST
jgi:NAD-dependent dihydropyrimidine dehydrogenase PreA subunit